MFKDKLLLILIPLVFASLLIIPIKNFSSGDDYAYYSTVENFLNGNFRLHANISMTFVLQGLYGALVSSIIGFSHSSLIIATIILSGITVVSVYIFLRKLVGRKFAFLGSLLFLFNPVYFYLSHTFMTDVPALSLVTLSFIFMYNGVQERKYKYILFGIIFSALAFGIRQYGLAPILGLALYYMLNKRSELLKLKNILLLIILPISLVSLWFYWYYYVHGPSDCITSYFTLGGNILRTLGKGGLFIGYFFLPVSLIYIANYKSVVSEFRKLKNIYKIIVTSLVVAMIGWLLFINIVQKDPIFYSTSLSSNLGLGATVNAISGEKNNIFPEIFWVPITLLSMVSATSILIHALSLANDKKYKFIFYILIAEILAILFIKAFYERYLMIFIVLMLPFMLHSIRDLRYGRKFLAVGIIIFAAWSFYGLYDYWNWNQARWDNINYLLSSGVDENLIDGGFEYNAEKFFVKCNDPPGAVNWHGWGYSISDEYVISFSVLDGYEEIHSVDYFGLLPFGENSGTVYALKKL